MSVVSATCYELLGVPVHAPRTEVARAWQDRRREALEGRRQRSNEEVEAFCSKLDEAYRTLVDPERAQRYRLYVERRRAAPPLEAPDSAGVDDPVRTPIARPWESRKPEDLTEVIEAVLESSAHELPDEDTINTLDEWGTADPELSRTTVSGQPARQALPVAPPKGFSATVTGRHRVIARARPTTLPSTRSPAPWAKDEPSSD